MATETRIPDAPVGPLEEASRLLRATIANTRRVPEAARIEEPTSARQAEPAQARRNARRPLNADALNLRQPAVAGAPGGALDVAERLTLEPSPPSPAEETTFLREAELPRTLPPAFDRIPVAAYPTQTIIATPFAVHDTVEAGRGASPVQASARRSAARSFDLWSRNRRQGGTATRRPPDPQGRGLFVDMIA